MKKGSFEFHKDWIEVLLSIPDRLRHKVMDAVLLYVNDGTMPTDPKVLCSPFALIQKQIERDMDKYNKIVEQRRISGAKGGRPRKLQVKNEESEKPKKANGFFENQTVSAKTKWFSNNISSKEDKDNIVVVVESARTHAHARTREGSAKTENAEFFDRYFDSGKAASLEVLTMQLHRENPATATLEDVKQLARHVIAEWEQNEEPPHETYNEWSRHLTNHIRIKNQKTAQIPQQQNENRPSNNNRANPIQQRAQRQADFRAHIAQKLGGTGGA